MHPPRGISHGKPKSLHLRSRKLEKALEVPPAADAEAALRTAFTDADNAAKAIILNSLTEEEVVRVMNLVTAKAMLDLLDQFHTTKSQASLAIALTKHRNLRMNEGGDIHKHLSEYDQIINEIRTLGGTLSEDQLAWGALLSLPSSWKASINQIVNRHVAPNFTYQNVRADLLLESEYSKAVDNNSSYKADENAKALATQGRQRETRSCFHCGIPGHIIKDCRKLKAEQARKGRSNDRRSDRNDRNDRSDRRNDRNDRSDRFRGEKADEGAMQLLL